MMNPRMDAPVKTGFHSRDTKALPVMFLGCPGAERRFPTKGGGANQESIRRTEGDEIHPVRASRTFHQRGYRLLYRIVARRDRISLVSQRHHRIDFHRSSRGHGAAQRSRNRQNQYNSDKRQRIAGRYTHQHHAQHALRVSAHHPGRGSRQGAGLPSETRWLKSSAEPAYARSRTRASPAVPQTANKSADRAASDGGNSEECPARPQPQSATARVFALPL